VLSGIYSIVCKTNDKGYLGSSKNIQARWKKHLYFLRKGNHVNTHLQNSFNLYGENSLEFRLIEDLTGSSPKEIREIEQIYLDQMDWSTSFNICKDSRGGEVTEEANERRRESLRKFHEENPDAIRGENNPFYGRTHKQSSKDQVSEKNTGKVRSEEYKRQKSEFMSSRRGRHHSEEHKANLRENYKGGNNPAAKKVTVNGVTYGSKKEALAALGLKYGYQLDRILNAERLSREGVESSDSKRVSPSSEG
jgi:group I intron endonuclease